MNEVYATNQRYFVLTLFWVFKQGWMKSKGAFKTPFPTEFQRKAQITRKKLAMNNFSITHQRISFCCKTISKHSQKNSLKKTSNIWDKRASTIYTYFMAKKLQKQHSSRSHGKPTEEPWFLNILGNITHVAYSSLFLCVWPCGGFSIDPASTWIRPPGS